MALTGAGLAHRMRCYACEHFCSLSPQAHTDLKWTRFCMAPGARDQWINITRDFLDGPASNCPAGYWTGLAAVDPDAEHTKALALMSQSQVARLGPMLKMAMQGDDEESVTSRLEEMVEAGMLQPEAAAQIAETVLKG